MKISEKNYPNIIQIGDVTQIKTGVDAWEANPRYMEHLDKGYNIDLLIGGSPCQGFSFAGRQLNFEDPRSKLFFEYVRLLYELKPKFFILENVRMKAEYRDKISEYLGVEPVIINSSLVSAQNRVRYYWVGELQEDGRYKKVEISQPKDKGFILSDIIQKDIEFSLCRTYTTKESVNTVIGNVNPSGRGQNGNVYDVGNKSPTLTTNKGEGVKIAQRPRGKNQGGFHSEKSPTLTSNLWEHNNKLCMQVGMADDINGHDILKRIYSPKGKCPTLVGGIGGNQEKKIALNELYYRKLTPIECERLQTMKDNYTEGVSNSQRYRMLGNGFTIDIISHILSHLKF